MGSLSCRYFEHLSSSIAMRSRLQFFVSRLATVKNFGIPDFWHQLLQHIAFYRKNLFVWLNYSYILSYSTLRSKISTVWNPRNLGTFFFQKLWFPKSGSWKYSRWAICKTVLFMKCRVSRISNCGDFGPIYRVPFHAVVFFSNRFLILVGPQRTLRNSIGQHIY